MQRLYTKGYVDVAICSAPTTICGYFFTSFYSKQTAQINGINGTSVITVFRRVVAHLGAVAKIVRGPEADENEIEENETVPHTAKSCTLLLSILFAASVCVNICSRA